MLSQFINIESLKELYNSSLNFDDGGKPSHKNFGAVYFVHNEQGEVIYVGKGKILSQRVSSHRQGVDGARKFYQEMVKVTYIRVDCPLERSAFEGIYLSMFEPKHNQEVCGRVS